MPEGPEVKIIGDQLRELLKDKILNKIHIISGKYCDKLKLNNKDKIIQKITGLVLDPYFSATKINWI